MTKRISKGQQARLRRKGIYEIPEYTVRRMRECDDDYPTRTYRVGDMVFDLETKTMRKIVKIVVGQMPDYPDDPLFYLDHGGEGRLRQEICLFQEADKYRDRDWIPAATPLDGNSVKLFRDPITHEKMITYLVLLSQKTESKRRGLLPSRIS
jgi:hypothetical protein